MSKLHPVLESFAAKARVNRAQYEAQYAESVRDPEGFWRRIAQRVEWIQPFTQVKDVSFEAADLHIRWFADGQLNVAANCLDRKSVV